MLMVTHASIVLDHVHQNATCIALAMALTKHGGHSEGNKCCCVRAASDIQSSTPNWSHVDFFAHSV